LKNFSLDLQYPSELSCKLLDFIDKFLTMFRKQNRLMS